MNAGAVSETLLARQETVALGRFLGTKVQVGWVIGLSGDLGAGKTTFTRGLAEGAGADPAGVTSPTFTFLHVYADNVNAIRLYETLGFERRTEISVTMLRRA